MTGTPMPAPVHGRRDGLPPAPLTVVVGKRQDDLSPVARAVAQTIAQWALTCPGQPFQSRAARHLAAMTREQFRAGLADLEQRGLLRTRKTHGATHVAATVPATQAADAAALTLNLAEDGGVDWRSFADTLATAPRPGDPFVIDTGATCQVHPYVLDTLARAVKAGRVPYPVFTSTLPLVSEAWTQQFAREMAR